LGNRGACRGKAGTGEQCHLGDPRDLQDPHDLHDLDDLGGGGRNWMSGPGRAAAAFGEHFNVASA